MSGPLVSFAQNGEDVVLCRALGDIQDGFYVDVGANDPAIDSVTRALYDRGWSGLTVEPVAVYGAAHHRERPRDTLVQAAAGARSEEHRTLHAIADTGLSTLRDDIAQRHRDDGLTATDVEVPALTLDDMLTEHGADGRELHLVVIDVEGAEAEVLRGLSLDRWRPWVLVVESTEPRSTVPSHGDWEPDVLAAGYALCLFDGLSRFYVAQERLAELGPALSYPACVLDHFVTLHELEVEADRNRAREDADRWRSVALESWAGAVTSTDDELQHEADSLQRELDAIRATLSWRVTGPLRAAQTRRLALRPRPPR